MSLLQKLLGKKTREVNITIVGLDNAGKTTMINYLLYGEFRTTIPTMGVNINTIKLPKMNVLLQDLGGQINFRKTIWAQVNEFADAIVYIVDSSDLKRIEESKNAFHKICETQIKKDIPVMILLNKIDIPFRMSRREFIQRFDLVELTGKVNWSCFETSAKTGYGLMESFSFFIDFLEDNAD